jgi:hypothetical protein
MASGNSSGLTRRLARVGPLAGGFLSLILTFGLAACGETLYEPDTLPDTTTVPDSIPTGGLPAVRVAVQAPGGRIELTDSIIVQVTAWDPARLGIDLAGYTAVIKSGGVERSETGEMTFPGTPRDTVTATFSFKPTWLQPSDLPAELAIEVYGNARNTAGVCGAAVPGSSQVFDCQGRNVGGISVTVATSRPADVPILVVRGRTTLFPEEAFSIGDLVVDTLRSRAYLSNRSASQLLVFDPIGFRFASQVSVGSEPWGLHLNGSGDTLLVANSGGTSLSHVSLTGTPREAVERRVQTRNTPLFEIKLKITVDTLPDGTEVADTLTQSVLGLDFSDRPQFVAKDAEGRILYSTRPTSAASRGTVRVVTNEVGWAEHETRVLVRIPEDVELAAGNVVVMNADSVLYYRDGFMEVWDHVPGFPDDIITSGPQRPMDALRTIYFASGSDVDFLADSKWNLEAVSFADTTYVAISRDRGYVAFGDGGLPGVGRVVVWHSPSATITRRLLVADLLNNASERVRALELNRDGSLGIARGSFGTYFFSKDLRLRGTVPESLGGGGAALHPDHPDTPAPLASSNVTLAFTISGDRTLRILDTVHYRERGRIQLRDNISGPMRVSPPLLADNGGQGRNCAGLNCVVAKVFAVTSSGGVVVIDVRASDISTLP